MLQLYNPKPHCSASSLAPSARHAPHPMSKPLIAARASLYHFGGLGQTCDGLQPLTHAQAFKGIKSLIVSSIFNGLPAKGNNPLWRGIGYASHEHAYDLMWQLK